MRIPNLACLLLCGGLSLSGASEGLPKGVSWSEPAPGLDYGRIYYYVPDGLDLSKRPGLFIFLHGGGAETNEQPGNYLKPDNKALRPQVDRLDFVTVAATAPHGRGDHWRWNHPDAEREILAIIEDVDAKVGIDRDRIVLGGQSMGGFGAYRQNIRTFDDRCWADLVFGNFGIPFRVTYDFTRDGVYALAGANAVARFSDGQLRQLLSRRIMIEGGAARALVARGFGRDLGVEVLEKAPLFTGDYDEMHKRAMPFPRSARPVIYKADPSAKTLSTLIWRESSASTDFERVSPSAVAYRNALGGLVAPLSFHNDMTCTYMYTEAHKEFILGVLVELGGAPLENVCGNAQNVMALTRRDAEGRDLILFENLNFDAEDRAILRRAAKPSAIEELDAHGVWRAVDFAYADGEAAVKGPWPCMDVRIFRIR